MSHTRLLLANLARNKVRTALTGGAITLAVALVCVMLTMPVGLDFILREGTSNARISVHHKAGLSYFMPSSFTRKVRSLDGVDAAVGMIWFGGTYEEVGRVTFPSFAVEAEHVGAVYPEYPIAGEQLADFRRYRDGAIVGRQLMEKYGWAIDDRVTLNSTAWPVELDFRIVGEIADPRAPYFWLRQEYLDAALAADGWAGLGVVTLIWVRANHPHRVDGIIQEIDALSRNSDAETASESEKSFFRNFFGSLEDLIRIMLFVTGLVSLCIVLIAANTASMTVRERTREIAILKAIGFGRRAIFLSLLGETLALSLLAGGIGVLLAVGLTGSLRVFAGYNQTLGPLANFVISAPVIIQGLCLSAFVGLVAGGPPSRGAARLSVAEALRAIF